jgi:hypothetical protein
LVAKICDISVGDEDCDWEGVKNVFFDNGVVDAVSTFLSDVRLCDAGTFVVVYWFE